MDARVLRTLRSPVVRQLIALCTICWILAPGTLVAPMPAFGDATPALVIHAPEIPLAALASNSPTRLAKQAQLLQRSTPLKPERNARYLPAAERLFAVRPLAPLHRSHRDLPRRSLPGRRTTPRAPDDPSH